MLASKTEKDALAAVLFFNVAHYVLRPWPWILVGLASIIVYPTLTDLALCDDGVDYFSFSECLNELVESEHMKKNEDGHYCITPRGIRLRSGEELEAVGQKLKIRVRERTSFREIARTAELVRISGATVD